MSRTYRLLSVVGLAITSSAAMGQTSWLNPVSGLWSHPANWSAGVPNGAGAMADFSVPGTYTASVNLGLQLLDLGIHNDGTTVEILNSVGFNYYGGTLDNEGVVQVNDFSSGSNTLIAFNESCTISGAGSLVLGASPASLNSAYITAAAGKVVHNGPLHTIRGTGNIYAPLVNDGVVEAGVDGRVLQLTSTDKTNNGTVRAVGGGIVQINGMRLTQGAAGILTSDGADLLLVNAMIAGGTVRATGGAHLVPSGTLVLEEGVTIVGPLDVPNGQALQVDQPILHHDGTLTVNPAAGASNTFIRFNQSGEIAGDCRIVLNAHPGSLDSAYIASPYGVSMTITGGAVVRGTGNIYTSFVNDGLVEADVGGRILQFASTQKFNNSTIRASGGGILQVSGIRVAQGPGGLLTSDAADLSLVSATISGGTVSATGGGRIVTTGVLTLEGGVRTVGPMIVPNAQGLVVDQEEFAHEGTVTVNPSAGGNNTFIRFNRSSQLASAGQIVLNANSGSLDSASIQSLGSATLTIADGAMVRGTGNIAIPLVNNGVVQADVGGRTLRLASHAKTNNATIRATGGGVLLVSGITINQSAGGRLACDGSDLVLSDCVIRGGDIEASGGAAIQVAGVATLAGGVNYFGDAVVPNACGLTISQAQTLHSGVTTINSSAGFNGTFVQFTEGSRLDGGEVMLNANPASLDTAYIRSQAGTLTLGGQEALRGMGRLYGSFVNDGVTSVGTGPGEVGVIDCQGNFAMGDESALEIDVGGVGVAEFDRVTCSGNVEVGGTLRVRLTRGYEPIGGETFDIVAGAGVTGLFSYYDFETYRSGTKRFAVRYLPGKVQVLARGCSADFDGSGFVDTDDFTQFVLTFEVGTDDADFDGSGFVDTDDFTAFVLAFEAGC